MEEVTLCPICSSSSFTPSISATDYTVSHETFNIVRCTSCELEITTPRPTSKNITTYYKSDDYISHSGKSSNLIDKIYLFVRSFTLNWKRRIVTNNSVSISKTLLDYGCGSGEFLQNCQQKGWSVNGVEPSEIGRKKTEQITGIKIAAELSGIQSTTFSAITLWHVLEHVENLPATLTTLSSLLEQNGTLFIAVPNHTCFEETIYKEHWAGYDVPRHLWHFSPKNIELLLNSRGLKLKKIVPMKLDAYYISLLSERYKSGNHTVPGMIRAVFNGLRSNIKAKKTMNYSSLIYIASK